MTITDLPAILKLVSEGSGKELQGNAKVFGHSAPRPRCLKAAA